MAAFAAGQSVATAGATSVDSTVCVRGWRLGRSQKKSLGFAPTASDRTAGWDVSAVMSIQLAIRDALAVLDHAAYRPAPARELAGGCDVGLVLVDAALEHRAPPLDEPSHAPGRVPSRRGVRDLPLGKVLRVRRAAKVVPRRLDEDPPQVLVAGLGDAALPHALAAGVLRRRQPEPCGERPGALEPGELAGLEDDVRGRHGVDSLQAAQRVDPLLPPGLRRLCLDQLLQPPLVLGRPPDGVDVVRENVVVGLLGC